MLKINPSDIDIIQNFVEILNQGIVDIDISEVTKYGGLKVRHQTDLKQYKVWMITFIDVVN